MSRSARRHGLSAASVPHTLWRPDALVAVAHQHCRRGKSILRPNSVVLVFDG
jgi:hypothetical protein